MFYGHVYSKDGKPISNVKVTDGRNIAITDPTGYYELCGWEKAHVISVQMLTRCHDDYYYYINEENECYDFYVSPLEECGESATFLHFSDTEIFIDGATADNWLGFVKSKAKELSPSFIIHTGDICRRAGLLEHYKIMNSENMGIPVRYTLGNHDYVDQIYGEYTFERLYGPLWYSFDLSGVHFVCLPIPSGEVKGIYEKEDAYRWLEKDLALKDPKMPLVVFCHTYLEDSPRDFILKFDEKTLSLRESGLVAWVFGHLHVNFVNEENGTLNVASGRPDFGGIDSTPASVRFGKIKGGVFKTEVHYNEEQSPDIGLASFDGRICFGAPVYADGDIFLSTYDDGYPKKEGVYRIGKDGRIIWKQEKYSAKYGIAYDDGRIFAHDTRGIIFALDANDGSVLWEKRIDCNGINYTPSSMTVRGAFVVLCSGNGIFYFDKESGIEVKSLKFERMPLPSVAQPVFYNGRIFYGRHWDAMYVIDEENLEIIKRIDDIKDSVGSPIRVEDRIYVPTRYSIVCVDTNGKIIMQSKRYGECDLAAVGTAAYLDGVLYFGTTFGGVVAFCAKDLSELHRFECGASRTAVCPYTGRNAKVALGKILIEKGELIYGSADGCVYFYDLATKDLKRRIDLGCSLLSGIVKADGEYWAADFMGNLHRFK